MRCPICSTPMLSPDEKNFFCFGAISNSDHTSICSDGLRSYAQISSDIRVLILDSDKYYGKPRVEFHMNQRSEQVDFLPEINEHIFDYVKNYFLVK